MNSKNLHKHSVPVAVLGAGLFVVTTVIAISFSSGKSISSTTALVFKMPHMSAWKVATSAPEKPKKDTQTTVTAANTANGSAGVQSAILSDSGDSALLGVRVQQAFSK